VGVPASHPGRSPSASRRPTFDRLSAVSGGPDPAWSANTARGYGRECPYLAPGWPVLAVLSRIYTMSRAWIREAVKTDPGEGPGFGFPLCAQSGTDKSRTPGNLPGYVRGPARFPGSGRDKYLKNNKLQWFVAFGAEDDIPSGAETLRVSGKRSAWLPCLLNEHQGADPDPVQRLNKKTKCLFFSELWWGRCAGLKNRGLVDRGRVSRPPLPGPISGRFRPGEARAPLLAIRFPNCRPLCRSAYSDRKKFPLTPLFISS